MTHPAQALQSAFPQYQMVAHKKASERMEQDMKKVWFSTAEVCEDDEGDCKIVLNTNIPYSQEQASRIGDLAEAAPDLLAALEAICKHATQCEMHGEPSTVDGIDWDDILKARAAIAKARK